MVISADRDYPAEKVTKEKPEALSTAEWNEFKKNLVVETKFIEFTVKG
jgi:hypothetical protein